MQRCIGANTQMQRPKGIKVQMCKDIKVQSIWLKVQGARQ